MTSGATPKPTGCNECAVRRLALFGPLTAAHVEAMQAHRSEQREVPAGGVIYAQDALLHQSFTVFDGWVMLHRTLSDGRRQVLRFALPGDFIGFQAHPQSPVLHSAQALTPVRVCVFERDELMGMFRQQPELAVQMAWITSRDEAITYDHLLSLGRRPAKERIAQLFLGRPWAHQHPRQPHAARPASGRVGGAAGRAPAHSGSPGTGRHDRLSS